MKPRRLTPNRAAAQVRGSIKRHINRLRKWKTGTVCEVLDDLTTFINNMAKRASHRPGGLGRRHW